MLESRHTPDVRARMDHIYANYMSTVENSLRQRGLNVDDRASLAILAGPMLQFLTVSDPELRSAVIQVGKLVTILEGANESPATALSRFYKEGFPGSYAHRQLLRGRSEEVSVLRRAR